MRQRPTCRLSRIDIEDERQKLGYLGLKIWTIFKTAQMTGNDAHADDVYLGLKRLSYMAKA